MFKKLLIASTVLVLSSSLAFANGAPYMGAGVGLQVNTNNGASYRGVPVNLFAGYGGDMGNGVYMAGEVSGVVATGTVTDNGLRSSWGYGVSFIPGFMISDHTMGYARFGLVRSRFLPGGHKSSTVTGGQAGLGLQTNLMQNWDMRGEYVYTAYNKIGGGVSAPRADAFNLDLVYKLD